MPDILIIILMSVIGALAILLWAYGIQNEDKELAIFAALFTFVFAWLLIWFVAADTPRPLNHEDVPIQTITSNDGAKIQMAVGSDGEVYNLTEKFKRSFPDNYKIRIKKPASLWRHGIYWVAKDRLELEVVKE